MFIPSWIASGRQRTTDGLAPRGRLSDVAPACRRHWRSAALLLLPILALSAKAAAQDRPAKGGQPELPLFKVEIVVFEQLQTPPHAEDPGRPPMPPMTEPATPLPGVFIEQAEPLPQNLQAAPADPEESDLESISEIFFVPAKLQDLSDIRSWLDRRSEYRVLAYGAWTQSGFDRRQARPVDLDTLARVSRLALEDGRSGAVSELPPAGGQEPFSASATLWLGRYLHLEIEAETRTERGPGKLTESRRMRSGELHYFDSPRIGAIAVVTPYDGAEARPTEPAGPSSAPGTGAG